MTKAEFKDTSTQTDPKSIIKDNRFLFIYFFLLIGIGIAYIIIQWVKTEDIVDALFVGLLLGATLVIFLGLRSVHTIFLNKGNEFLYGLSDHGEDITAERNRIIRELFNNRRMIGAGIIYGTAVTLAVIWLQPWEDYPIISGFLASFLFIVNFTTGMGLFGLVMLFKKCYEYGSRINVDLFTRDNKSVKFVLEVTKRAAITAAIYVGMSVISIFVSVLPISNLTIGYSVFSCVCIILAYVMPMVPVRNAIAKKKNEVVEMLERKTQQEYDSLISSISSNESELSLTNLKTFHDLRDMISGINTVPFAHKIIKSSVSVFILTILPIGIKSILPALFD